MSHIFLKIQICQMVGVLLEILKVEKSNFSSVKSNKKDVLQQSEASSIKVRYIAAITN